jgi:hypothetical protein
MTHAHLPRRPPLVRPVTRSIELRHGAKQKGDIEAATEQLERPLFLEARGTCGDDETKPRDDEAVLPCLEQ